MVTFDYLAPHYRWMESLVFGQSLQRCRLAWLDQLKEAKNLLIVGEGNGRFLSAFLAMNANARVDCIDISPRMLALARRRASRIPGAVERVNFIACDLTGFSPQPCRYDALATNFILDCFAAEQLAGVVAQLGAALRQEGLWIVGDFRRPHQRAAALRAEVALKAMYLCFRLATRLPTDELVDPNPMLRSEGMELMRTRQWQNGFLSSQLWRKIG